MCSGNDDEVSSILLSGLSSGVLSFEVVERKLPEAAFLPAPLAASTSSANRLCSVVPPTWRALCFAIPRPAPDVGVPSDGLDGPGSDDLAPSALARRAYGWADGTLWSATNPGPAWAEDEGSSSALPAVLCLAPILSDCCFSIFYRV